MSCPRKPNFLLRAVAAFRGAGLTIDARELTFAENHGIGSPLWQEFAMSAGFTAGAQCAALTALDQPGYRFLVAALVGADSWLARRFRASIRSGLPEDHA